MIHRVLSATGSNYRPADIISNQKLRTLCDSLEGIRYQHLSANEIPTLFNALRRHVSMLNFKFRENPLKCEIVKRRGQEVIRILPESDRKDSTNWVFEIFFNKISKTMLQVEFENLLDLSAKEGGEK